MHKPAFRVGAAGAESGDISRLSGQGRAFTLSAQAARVIAKDFKEFIRICGMTHVRTSRFYPQSNGKLERRHKSVKSECIRPGTPLSIEDARRWPGGPRLQKRLSCGDFPVSLNWPRVWALLAFFRRHRPDGSPSPSCLEKADPGALRNRRIVRENQQLRQISAATRRAGWSSSSQF